MSLEDLIPKFEPGERVIYHDHPVEFSCPHCGIGYSQNVPIRKYTATVITQKTGDLICLQCGKTSPCPDGWYRIKTDEDFQDCPGYNTIAVPYTLLERVSR